MYGQPPPGIDSGYGDGYGYGGGFGFGGGYGYGYGFGDGYGDGYGYGYGFGYGEGEGEGYGYGYGDYWGLVALDYAKERGAALVEQGCVLAFWKSGPDGKPCNGGDGEAVQPGTVQEIAGPLELCTHRALHATYEPWGWDGPRLWVVALHPPVEGGREKIGSLKREIICEITPNPFGGNE